VVLVAFGVSGPCIIKLFVILIDSAIWNDNVFV
jgi:hypothetical protein